MRKEEVIDLLNKDCKKDLHIHTVFSDGVLTPEQVIDRWMKEGNEVIAITDHDGIDGSIIAMKYAEDKDVTVIPGIEFDSENDLGKDLHILGYGIDFDNETLHSRLVKINEWRDARNQVIIDALDEQGIHISDEEIYAINEGRYIGKPTFARILVNRGMFRDLASVFNDFFGKNAAIRAIKKASLDSKDVVETIHAAGGIVVLAHPMEQMKTGESFEEFEPRLLNILETFIGYGIDGIECYHPSASPEQSEYLRKFAEEHHLLITRGSDFHFDGMNRIYTRS